MAAVVAEDDSGLAFVQQKKPRCTRIRESSTTQATEIYNKGGCATRCVQAHSRAVTAICVTHDAMYTTSLDGLLKRWTFQSDDSLGYQVKEESMVSLGHECLSMVCMGAWLFCGLCNGSIRAFSKDGADTILTSCAKNISTMLAHDGILFVASAGGLITCWQMKEDVTSYVMTHSVENLFHGQACCLAALDGALWLGSEDGVHVVELPMLGRSIQLEPRKRVAGFLGFQSCMITAFADGSILIFDCRGDVKHSQSPLDAGPIVCMLSLEPGPKVICAHSNGWTSAIDLPSFVLNKSWPALSSCEATCVCEVNRNGICIIGTDTGALYIMESSAPSGEYSGTEDVATERAAHAHKELLPEEIPAPKNALKVSAGEPLCTSGHLCQLSANNSHPRGWRCYVCGARKRSERWSCDKCSESYCLDCFPWYLPGVRCYDKKEREVVDGKWVRIRKGSASGSAFVTFKVVQHREILISKLLKNPAILGGIRIEMKPYKEAHAVDPRAEKLDCAEVSWTQPGCHSTCKLLVSTLKQYIDRLCDSLTALEVES